MSDSEKKPLNIIYPREGGAAFPQNIRDGAEVTYYHGMSMRDYFAGQALPGAIEAVGVMSASSESYRVTNMMLAERSSK